MPRLPSRPHDPRFQSARGWPFAGRRRHVMIQPTRLPIDLARSSKPSSQRNRLVARRLNPFRPPDYPAFCLCAAPQSSPSAAHQAQSNNYPQLALCFAPPIHQTKPIAHAPCSGLVQSIFSSPARLRSPSLPAYTCCRRAAKLKMLCMMCREKLCAESRAPSPEDTGCCGVRSCRAA